jgi:Uma2 family endonuclease
MTNVALNFPVTMQERLELGPDLVRFPASRDEFWELLEVAEYPVEFYDNTIIAMSYESDPHSQIASNIGSFLNNALFDNDAFKVFNSNRPIYPGDRGGSVFNPDASVVLMEGRKYEYARGMNAEMDPVVVVEVLSHTTREHDLEVKLPAYKGIPTVEAILYVENQMPYVTLYARNAATGKWVNTVYDSLDDSFEVLGQTLSLRRIYHKVKFIPRQNSR